MSPTPAMHPPLQVPYLCIRFANSSWSSTEFRHPASRFPYLASATRGGRVHTVRYGRRAASLLLFLLHQRLWVARDPDRATREIDEARTFDQPVPESAPEWEERDGPFVATLAEAIKTKHRNPLTVLFGGHLSFVEDSFRYGQRPPAVWLDVRHFSPLSIGVVDQGTPLEDAPSIAALMHGICQSHGWDSERLLRR